MKKKYKTINLPKINDNRGNLSFIEGDIHIPFGIKRAYYLYDIPGGAERGGHAHYNLQQLIIPLAGSFDIYLDDGKNQETVSMNRAYMGLIIEKMVWRELKNFSSGAVCLCLASDIYRPEDYIHKYSDFIQIKNNINGLNIR